MPRPFARPLALAVSAGLLVLTAGACTPPTPAVETPPEDPAAAAPVPVPPDGETGLVSLAPGDTFDLALPANPSTGYTWEVTVPDVLRQESGGTFTTDAPPDVVGAGGTMTWRFRAVRPGEGELVLVYRRPWEQGTPPVRTARYRVVVVAP